MDSNRISHILDFIDDVVCEGSKQQTAEIKFVMELVAEVRRCIEQWYVWFIVNVLTLIIWIIAYYNGSNCFATIIMWATYVFLAVYFLKKWQKNFLIDI